MYDISKMVVFCHTLSLDKVYKRESNFFLLTDSFEIIISANESSRYSRFEKKTEYRSTTLHLPLIGVITMFLLYRSSSAEGAIIIEFVTENVPETTVYSNYDCIEQNLFDSSFDETSNLIFQFLLQIQLWERRD